MNISPRENLTMAMTAVWTNRFRSMLTILGIVIGITTVVTVASLLTGLRAGVVTFFDDLGPDNIFLFKTSGDPSQSEAMSPLKEHRRRAIDPAYADVIRRTVNSVESVSVLLYIPPAPSGTIITARVPGFETDSLSILGASANSVEQSPRGFDQGRFYTDEEELRGAHVAVLGYSIAHALFPDGDALNRTFAVDGAEFTAIGVFEKAKGGFFGENAQDSQIEIPLTTAHARYPNIDRYMITSKAKPGARKVAFDDIQAVIRRQRHTPAGTGDDFALSTPDQIIEQFDKITGLIGVVAIAISGLGLLVGGIGVMNIMLVSVTERTREIGIRKALGARRIDIIGQFLAEAMALTAMGGVLGILFAVAISLILGVAVPALPSTIPSWAIIAGLTVSMAVGLFFGVWPAMKASRLDPVEALRYE